MLSVLHLLFFIYYENVYAAILAAVKEILSQWEYL